MFWQLFDRPSLIDIQRPDSDSSRWHLSFKDLFIIINLDQLGLETALVGTQTWALSDSIEIPQKEILLVLFSKWFWEFIRKSECIGIVLKVTFIFWISKRSFKCLTGRTTRGPTRPISAKFHGVKSTCQSWIVNWFENFWLPKKIEIETHTNIGTCLNWTIVSCLISYVPVSVYWNECRLL